MKHTATRDCGGKRYGVNGTGVCSETVWCAAAVTCCRTWLGEICVLSSTEFDSGEKYRINSRLKETLILARSLGAGTRKPRTSSHSADARSCRSQNVKLRRRSAPLISVGT